MPADNLSHNGLCNDEVEQVETGREPGNFEACQSLSSPANGLEYADRKRYIYRPEYVLEP